ncbi:MAG TPA: hypothetical protein ACFCUD_04440 [Cyclobacteriaceae bacterium]
MNKFFGAASFIGGLLVILIGLASLLIEKELGYKPVVLEYFLMGLIVVTGIMLFIYVSKSGLGKSDQK